MTYAEVGFQVHPGGGGGGGVSASKLRHVRLRERRTRGGFFAEKIEEVQHLSKPCKKAFQPGYDQRTLRWNGRDGSSRLR